MVRKDAFRSKEGTEVSGIQRRSDTPDQGWTHRDICSTRLTGFVLLVLFTAGPAEAMIVNGGFENGVLNPWFQDRDLENALQVDWDATMADARSGNWSATATGNLELRQNFSGVDTALIAEISFWLKHPAGNKPSFISLFYDDGSVTDFTRLTTGADWEQLDVTADLEAGKVLNGFSVFGFNSGGQPGVVFLDDVLITTVPLPPAFALLMTALVTARAFGRARK